MSRILIITNGNYFACQILAELFRVRASEISSVIVVKGDYRGQTGVRAGLRLMQQMTLPYFLFKLTVYMLPTVLRVLRRKFAGFEHDVPMLIRRWAPGATHISVSRLNSSRVARFARGCCPDLIVSVSCPQKIGAELLKIPRYGGINVHSARLPAYAGLAPYFWVLANNEKSTGVTVHRMTEKWDAGDILAQHDVPIEPRMSAFGLFRSLAETGGRALIEGVDRALRGEAGEQQDLRKRSYYSHPRLADYVRLRRNGHSLIRWADVWLER